VKRRYFFIILSLLISLFIYLFYRTEKTVVNEIAIRILSIQDYTQLRDAVIGLLPLSKPVIYSLPEGLWVFSITLTSKPFYIPFFGRQVHCTFMPLLFCIGLELCQLYHFTNGRFDFMDIWFSAFFWIIACRAFNEHPDKQSILQPVNKKSLVCFASYGIVYLAHVIQ